MQLNMQYIELVIQLGRKFTDHKPFYKTEIKSVVLLNLGCENVYWVFKTFKCSLTMLMRFVTSPGDSFCNEVTYFRITQQFRRLVSLMINIDIVAFE